MLRFSLSLSLSVFFESETEIFQGAKIGQAGQRESSAGEVSFCATLLVK